MAACGLVPPAWLIVLALAAKPNLCRLSTLCSRPASLLEHSQCSQLALQIQPEAVFCMLSWGPSGSLCQHVMAVLLSVKAVCRHEQLGPQLALRADLGG